MSLRNRLVVPVVFSALAVLAGCGGSNNPQPTPPPSGSFSDSNLNGTYVFSVSGTDSSGAPWAAAGTFTANGSGGITGGALDFNDAAQGLAANQTVTGGNYKVNVDGRGTVSLANAALSGMTLDFVLQDSSHGLLTEFDSSATGSGTLDLQSAGVSAAGTYAFNMAGFDFVSASSFATVGNFTVGSGGAITGLQDLNAGAFAYPDLPLSGSIALGPSSTPATVLAPSGFSTSLTFDVIAIDASHLKFIEMDSFGNLVGDAYSQTTTTIPQSTFAFTLGGSFPGNSNSSVSVAGGFIVTDGAGNIQSTSSVDANDTGSVTSSPITFSGTYAAGGAGRYTMTLSGFTDGTSFALYPYSGGWFLLEIDDGGAMSGAAYPQSQNVFNSAQGYGLNLTGENLTNGVEVDDIAEFTAASGGSLTGIVDENAEGVGPNPGLALTGSYTAPSSGRGSIAATAGNSSNSTLNGVLGLTFYSVDGTTFPFIETDTNGQVALGTMFQQNPTASAAAAATAKNHMFVVRTVPKVHTNWQKKQK
jgi:hypothetical protein